MPADRRRGSAVLTQERKKSPGFDLEGKSGPFFASINHGESMDDHASISLLKESHERHVSLRRDL